MDQDRSNNTFWAFLVVVLVLGVGGAAFSYFARNAAADAALARELEIEQREAASKGLLEQMLATHGTESDIDTLRTWFETRFQTAWTELHPGTQPPPEVLLDAVEAFKKKLELIPAEVAKELTGKK